LNYFINSYTKDDLGLVSEKTFSDSIVISKNHRLRSKNIGESLSKINSFFFEFLQQYNLPLPEIIQKELVRFVHQPMSIFPFKLKVLNSVDSRNSVILSKKEFEQISTPIFEFYVGDCLEYFVSDSHLITLNLCDANEVKLMLRIASKANVVLKSFFERRNFYLLEFNCFFGKLDDKIFLVGDFSPFGIFIKDMENSELEPNPYKLTNSKLFGKYTAIIFKLLY